MTRPKTTKTGGPHYSNLYKDLQEEYLGMQLEYNLLREANKRMSASRQELQKESEQLARDLVKIQAKQGRQIEKLRKERNAIFGALLFMAAAFIIAAIISIKGA